MKPVKIYAIHFNRPEFIRWQHDSFKKHLKDDFELIIVNNAIDEKFIKEINDICKILHLSCIETHFECKLVGKHHADCFNQIWKEHAVKNSNHYNVMMDGDCFLIKPFNINEFMGNNVLAGPKQKRPPNFHYLTPTVIISNIDGLPAVETIDWEGIGVDLNGEEIRLDTGGGLYNYYLDHPEVKERTKELRSSWHIKQENNNRHCIPDSLLSKYNDEYHVEFFGNEILHYCRSSNWNYQTDQHHQLKAEFVKEFIYGTIDGSVAAKDHNFQSENKIYFGWEE